MATPFPVHLATLEAPPDPGVPSLEQLNEGRRLFVLHYVLGEDEVRGIAYKSYLAAGYTAANLNTASAAAAQLLRDPKVKKAIREIHDEMETEFRARMRSWTYGAVKAQELLERTVDTALGNITDDKKKLYPTANQLLAARDLLDRALGRPKQPHEHDIGDKLDDLIKSLAERARAPQLPSGASAKYIGEGHLVDQLPSGE